MKKYLLCLIFLNIAYVISNASDKVHWPERAFEYYQGGRIDTVYHIKYTVLFYKGRCNDGETTVGLDIIEGKDTLISLMNCELTLYDFCSDSMITDDNGCIFRDINNDGIPEMIIDLYWGGMHCCHEYGIYSLSNPAKILAHDLDDSPGVTIKDLDQDSIPEFYYCNREWPWCDIGQFWGSTCPPLIWKWDGTELKLANYKFPDIVLLDFQTPWDQLKRDYVDQAAQNQFDLVKNSIYSFMALYAFAGKLNLADSLLNYCWPEGIPSKAKADSIFMNWLTTDQYWPDIQKSNW